MGYAGLTRAGFSLAGQESLVTSKSVGLTAPLLAVLYDPKTRQFNPNIAMDPVDQAVAIALGVALGSCTSAPKVGLKKPLMRNPGGQQPGGQSLQRRCYDAVALALKSILARKDITIVAVEPIQDLSVPGRLIVAVTYHNNRLNSLSGVLPPTTVLTNPPGG